MLKVKIIEKKAPIVVDKGPKNQKKRAKSQFNAVKSGAYAAGLLPFESREAYEKHLAAFRNSYAPVGYIERDLVDDMARNRWQRKRTRLMMAVAMHRHPFGRTVLESEARSWKEAASFVHDSNTPITATLESIRDSMRQLAELGEQLKETLDPEVVSKCLNEVADACSNSYEVLQDIETNLDQEREFFEQYVPEKLEQTVRLDNALDAQFEKQHSRLQVIQEARLRRDQLLLANQQAAAVLLLGKPADRTAADEGGTESDAVASADSGEAFDGGDQDDADEGPDPLNDFVKEQKKQ